MRKVNNKKTVHISQAIVDELQDWLPYIHTNTAVNGKEFAAHAYVSTQLNIKHYFEKPHHAWEGGSNENLNGLIRQYFKKSTDFSQITEKQIKKLKTL